MQAFLKTFFFSCRYPKGEFQLGSNVCDCQDGGKFSCEPIVVEKEDDSADKNKISKRILQMLAGLKK